MSRDPLRTAPPREPACSAAINGVEYPVDTVVALELNRLRIAAMGGNQLIAEAVNARDEALDLLAEIIGPTTGPMTMPTAAALEAWSNRARHMLANRQRARTQFHPRPLQAVPPQVCRVCCGQISTAGHCGCTDSNGEG